MAQKFYIGISQESHVGNITTDIAEVNDNLFWHLLGVLAANEVGNTGQQLTDVISKITDQLVGNGSISMDEIYFKIEL